MGNNEQTVNHIENREEEKSSFEELMKIINICVKVSPHDNLERLIMCFKEKNIDIVKGIILAYLFNDNLNYTQNHINEKIMSANIQSK